MLSTIFFYLLELQEKLYLTALKKIALAAVYVSSNPPDETLTLQCVSPFLYGFKTMLCLYWFLNWFEKLAKRFVERGSLV